ncbi:MAG: PhnD/SsuA/transferrin family substrate-binding protein [Gammaproteobacteria bacterium]|nr:PhnD/SsuA/transferrin family substrate-binding protein [Gammaproteobacteria bacterium]
MLPTASLQIPTKPMLRRLIDVFCPVSLFFLVACLFTASGCSPRDASAEAGNGPEVLRLAYLPSEEDPEGRMEAVELLAAHLEAHVGRPVKMIRAVQYAPTIEAMRAGKVDIVRSGGPFVYLVAHREGRRGGPCRLRHECRSRSVPFAHRRASGHRITEP